MEDFIAAGGTGVRFFPTDEELIMLYLFNKHAGRPLPHKEFILECDLYGSKEPWDVFEECSATASSNSSGVDDRVKYFFTTLKRKSKKSNFGTRFERKVAGKNGGGGGKWHGNGQGKQIWHDKKVVGYVTTFTYKKKNEKGGGSGDSWLMKEYTLDERVIKALTNAKKRDKTVSRDCVLCRIKRKRNKKKDRDRHLMIAEAAVESNLATDAVAAIDPISSLPPQISDQYDHHHGFNNLTNAGAELLVPTQQDDHVGGVACDQNHVISDITMTDTIQDDETDRQLSEFTASNELCPPQNMTGSRDTISTGAPGDIIDYETSNKHQDTGADDGVNTFKELLWNDNGVGGNPLPKSPYHASNMMDGGVDMFTACFDEFDSWLPSESEIYSLCDFFTDPTLQSPLY